MDLGRMLERIGRRLFNRAMSKGINAGIGKVTGAGKGGGKAYSDLSPAERAELKRARETDKRARQAARVTRRMGKF